MENSLGCAFFCINILGEIIAILSSFLPIDGLKLTFLLLLSFLCVSVSAEEPAPITVGEYVINPGDTISILVWGHAEYTQTIPVRPDGKISYPFLGEVKVDGLTTTQLAEKVREELLKHLINPQVTVIIAQPKKNEVFVLGQVKFPNQFRFDQDKISILKVLSMAGGVLDDTADLHSVEIIKDDGTSETVDLEKLLASKLQQLVFLFPGDVVYVPKKEYIRVTGYVLSPGEFRTKSGLSAMQALAIAGGPVLDTADLSNTLIVRSTGEVISVKLDSDLLYDDEKEYMLYPGDALYVPGRYEFDQVNILGYVRNPGRYKIKKPVSLFEGLSLAGGIVNVKDADLQNAHIIRENGRIEQIDLSVLQNPTVKDIQRIANIQLYPDDTLEIPQKVKLMNWPLTLTVVSVVSITYNLFANILR